MSTMIDKSGGRYLFWGMGAVVLIAVYYLMDPGEESWILACPFKAATGWDCPGCGSQRAFHSLLHGHWKEALAYNSLFVVLLPYAVAGLIWHLPFLKNKAPKWRTRLYSWKVIFLLALFAVVFGVVRNL